MDLNESGQEVSVLLARLERLTAGLAGPQLVKSVADGIAYRDSLAGTNAPAEMRKCIDRLRTLLKAFGLVE